MKRVLAIVTFLTMTVGLASSATAQAEMGSPTPPPTPTYTDTPTPAPTAKPAPPRARGSKKLGIGTSFGIGYQSLVGAGDFDNYFDDGSVGFRFGADYMVLPFLSVGLEFDFGFLGPDDSSDDASTYHVMLVALGHYHLGPVHLFGGLGFGYGGVSAEITDDDVDYSSFLNLKFTMGALYKVWKELEVGLYLDTYLHLGGEVCIESTCEDMGDDIPGYGYGTEVNNMLQFGLLTRYTF